MKPIFRPSNSTSCTYEHSLVKLVSHFAYFLLLLFCFLRISLEARQEKTRKVVGGALAVAGLMRRGLGVPMNGWMDRYTWVDRIVCGAAGLRLTD
jgi:hypothetical protein